MIGFLRGILGVWTVAHFAPERVIAQVSKKKGEREKDGLAGFRISGSRPLGAWVLEAFT